MRFVGGLTFDEKMNSLCQPDQLFFIQFFDTFRRRLYLEPEKILMLAVLEDAVACLRKYACRPQGKGKRLFREAMDWLMIQDVDWPFSFDNVCEALGLDAGYVRRGLIQMVETLVKSGSTIPASRESLAGKERSSGTFASLPRSPLCNRYEKRMLTRLKTADRGALGWIRNTAWNEQTVEENK